MNIDNRCYGKKYQNPTLYTQINSSNHKNFPYYFACYHINGAEFSF